jgi:ferredoxin-fold anticodon binding domain-containing protein
MHPLVRHRGQAVEVRDIHGRVHRGVLAGVDPARGIFISSGFARFFIPFFLIATIFLLSTRLRIF